VAELVRQPSAQRQRLVLVLVLGQLPVLALPVGPVGVLELPGVPVPEGEAAEMVLAQGLDTQAVPLAWEEQSVWPGPHAQAPRRQVASRPGE
jgi:hypothetical protein